MMLGHFGPGRIFHFLAAIAIATGVVFWFWNPEPPAKPDGSLQQGFTSPRETKPAVPETPMATTAIIGANIFSATRTPPSRRYDPANPEGSGISTGGAPDMMMESPAQENLPQLFGTVLGPAGAMALMQGDSSDGPGSLFREGDRLGQFRIVKVKSNSVIVSGPSGRIEIPVERNPTGSQ
ncbi:MAG: hypothetical protein H0T21_04660 [Gemmatimonadaceae bacterium]|nr:hypothetical protein [Gemmatimonadaceae bacterium]